MSSPSPASSVDDWAAAGKNGKTPDRAPTSSCRELMALLRRAPNPFVAELEQHVKLGAAREWGVQLAAGFDRNRALAMYSRAMKRLSAVIGDQDPSLLGTTWRSRGIRTFYQVRIGADTRVAADDLCNRIRRAGGACFVLRNMNGRALTAANRRAAVNRGSLDAGTRFASVMRRSRFTRSGCPCRFLLSTLPDGKAPRARSRGACARSPRRC